MTFRVGITGGMGSGKSTVAAIFETLGVPVYRADDAAKRLMQEDPVLKAQLIQNFGVNVYANGRLNRQYLANIVFNDEQKLMLLNSFVHPATINDGERWMQQQTAPYAIREAAIIFESGSQRYLDYIIGVYAPTTLRMHRSMQRSNLSRKEVIARMNKQMDDHIKMKLCDAVITNDGQQALVPQVVQLNSTLAILAQRLV